MIVISKDFDNLTDEDKIFLTTTSLKIFSDLVGPDDVYKQILLEEVFRYLLMAEEED